jgi:L-asparaginase
VPELKEFDYVIKSYQFDPPIDSSDMQPELWAKLVNIIDYNYQQYDGFVILHGTDTMAYTASALSFMLENLGKPVVLTGSQLPIGVLRTDGKENMINAIEFAAACDEQSRPLVPEVCVCFGQKLYRGNRVTKCNAENFSAFKSYNYPPLAVTGINIDFDVEKIRKIDPEKKFTPHVELDNSVIAITLFPGIRSDVIENVFRFPGIKGIVLRTFGSGNAPRLQWLIDAIKAATRDGKIVVNITQCQMGSVEMGLYATGNQLLEAGVVSGRDMTVECAVTKLMVLFGQGYSSKEVRELMCKSLAGEMKNE